MSHSGIGQRFGPSTEVSTVGGQVARSALDVDAGVLSPTDVEAWLAAGRLDQTVRVERRPLTELTAWSVDPDTGNIGHASGRFFSIEGVEVLHPGGPIERWTQPIVHQPEVGIQGLLVKELDGVLHCLIQVKAEPGNYGGMQLAPTVQATRSNYTAVHGGNAVPYLSHFQTGAGHSAISDVRQSEQGTWCFRKHNRYKIVRAAGPIEVLPGFAWLTLRQVYELLHVPDLVNWALRSVLADLPFSGDTALALSGPDADPTGLAHAIHRSLSVDAPTALPISEVLSWITEVRTANDVKARLIPLRDVELWVNRDGRIEHESGHFFQVRGFEVAAGHREVSHWSQPMFEATPVGLCGLLAKRIDGVLHVLMHARVEAGFADVVELGPTVQCMPDNYSWLPATARPTYLDLMVSAPASRIRFDVTHSEEGGRFYHVRNRYLIVDVDDDRLPELPDYRWLSLHQLGVLVQHSHYLNVQARSLLADLHSLGS
jgi:oxidase EvaA